MEKNRKLDKSQNKSDQSIRYGWEGTQILVFRSDRCVFASVLFESDSGEGSLNGSVSAALVPSQLRFIEQNPSLLADNFNYFPSPDPPVETKFMHLAKIAFSTCTETELPPGNPQT